MATVPCSICTWSVYIYMIYICTQTDGILNDALIQYLDAYQNELQSCGVHKTS